MTETKMGWHRIMQAAGKGPDESQERASESLGLGWLQA